MAKTRKRSHPFLVMLFALILAVASGLVCAGIMWKNMPDTPAFKAAVISIEVDASEAKTDFKFGGPFNSNGLKVTANMSDKTTKEVELSECKITIPDMETPGEKEVDVTYQRKKASYTINVNEKAVPALSDTSLMDITAATNTSAYRVEAENIDMDFTETVKADSEVDFVQSDSGNKYVTGYGVKWNYFGFKFTSDQKYTGATIVLRVSNSNEEAIDLGDALAVYLNHEILENGTRGEIDLDGYTLQPGVGEWRDIVLRDVTISAGTNTFAFEARGNQIANIDYVDFYVGGINYGGGANITLGGVGKASCEIENTENFNLDKAFTRSDVAAAHGLGMGQLFVETSPSSGGKSVGAIAKGSEITSTLILGQPATVKVSFTAASVNDYVVKDNWLFKIDNVKLSLIESLNIKGGDASAGNFWDWKETNVGIYNLSAGNHFFEMRATGIDCNVDTVNFEVISYGSYDASGKDLATVDSNNSTTLSLTQSVRVEAETFDNEQVISRQDFIDAGRVTSGQYFTEGAPGASGGKCICGFETGSKFVFTLIAPQAMKVRVDLVGATDANPYIIGERLRLVVAGLEIAGSTDSLTGTTHDGIHSYWDWQTATLGTFEFEEGKNTMSIEILSGYPNLDCIIFTPVIENLALSATGETRAEAENFTNEQVVTRQDFVDADRCNQGEYVVENATGASNNQCISGFAAGTKFTVKVDAPEAKQYRVDLIGATDAADYTVSGKLKITVNNTEVSGIEGSLTGSGSAPYWDWQTISLGIFDFSAGENVVEIEILEGHPNLDCLVFTAV